MPAPRMRGAAFRQMKNKYFYRLNIKRRSGNRGAAFLMGHALCYRSEDARNAPFIAWKCPIGPMLHSTNKRVPIGQQKKPASSSESDAGLGFSLPWADQLDAAGGAGLVLVRGKNCRSALYLVTKPPALVSFLYWVKE